MKAILEFDLNDPNDYHPHLRAVHATQMAQLLFFLKHNFRKSLEMFEDDPNVSKSDYIDIVYRNLSELFEDRGVSIDNLIA